MSVPRISELTVSGLVVGTDKRPRLSRLLVEGTVGSSNKRPRLSRLVVTGTQTVRKPRISGLTITGSIFTGTVAHAGPDITAEPGSVVTLDAYRSQGDGITYAWEILSGGDGVTLSGGPGSARTLVAPRDAAGRTVVAQVTVTATNGSSATDTVTVTVRTHQLWFLDSAGVFIPVRNSFLRI